MQRRGDKRVKGRWRMEKRGRVGKVEKRGRMGRVEKRGRVGRVERRRVNKEGEEKEGTVEDKRREGGPVTKCKCMPQDSKVSTGLLTWYNVHS